MNTFYERIDDGEFFVYDEESKKFYIQSMEVYKNKGHLIMEYAEKDLDKLVEAGLFKKHTKNPVVTAQHDVITDLILENKVLKEEAKKWEDLYDSMHDVICHEINRDGFGPLETEAECLERLMQELKQFRKTI